MISNSSINIVWWKLFCGSTNIMNDAITSFDQSTSAINSEKEWFAHIRFINSYLRYLSLTWIQIMWLKSVIWQKLVFLKQLFGHYKLIIVQFLITLFFNFKISTYYLWFCKKKDSNWKPVNRILFVLLLWFKNDFQLLYLTQ